MSSEIQVFHTDRQYETKSFSFPGGELQVQLPGFPNLITGEVTVLARLQSPEGLVRLLLVTELLSRLHRSGRRTLVVPYFPYARQDRVMRRHEAFSLKPVARLINSLGFEEVVTFDPHSDVTPALVENLRVVPQVDLAAEHAGLRGIVKQTPSQPIVVAPDAGAAKKAFAVAQHFGLPLLTASKVRDTATGAILRTELNVTAPLASADVLIVDDICDGGRTFVELAKVLRSQGAGRVFLYVTHGIFSQGLGVFSGLIDGVFTTNSFLSCDVKTPHQSPVPLHVSTIHF